MATHLLRPTRIYLGEQELMNVRSFELTVGAEQLASSTITLLGIPEIVETPDGLVVTFQPNGIRRTTPADRQRLGSLRGITIREEV